MPKGSDGDNGPDPEGLEADEYRSLRAESLQAKSNQQSILQWSIGAVGVVTAALLAALATIGDSKGSGDTRLRLDAVFLSLGVVVPTLLAAAFAVWIGEVERMERVGRYLRAREETKWAWPPPAITSDRAFRELAIFWESLIAAPRLGSTYGKNQIGSLATCLLYGISFVVSEMVGIVALWTARPSELTRPLQAWRASVIAALILISTLILLLLGQKLWQIRRRAASHRDVRSRSAQTQVLPDITVILPCFNEISALQWVLARMAPGFEPLVVDNGSTDGSGSFATQLGVRCIFQYAKGIGPTVVAGFAADQLGEIVCVMDCDGTVDPRDLPFLTAPISLDAADLVIGARRGYDSRVLLERILSRLQAFYVRRRLDIPISDLGSAMAVSRKLLALVSADTIDNGNAWKIELLLRARNTGARIAQVRIDHSARIGTSKITGTWAGRYATAMDALHTAGWPISIKHRGEPR